MHPSVPVSRAAAEQRFHDAFKTFRCELNSHRPFQEVEIPFTLHSNRPYVQAAWSGRKLDCLVDTGAYFLSWPQWLQLDTQQLGVPWSSAGPEGPPVPGELVVSPRIEIGELTLINMVTEATGVAKPSPLSSPEPQRPAEFSGPTLGIYTFLTCVFTIDYRHNKLILRNTDYDVTRLSSAPRTRLIPYEEDSAQRVVLRGTLAGHPTRFLLDTGSTEMCVSADFARRHLGYVPKPELAGADLHSAQRSLPVVQNVPATLFGKPFTFPAMYVVEHAGTSDVLLGAAFFSQYRVTVDPKRKVVLLERNP